MHHHWFTGVLLMALLILPFSLEDGGICEHGEEKRSETRAVSRWITNTYRYSTYVGCWIFFTCTKYRTRIAYMKRYQLVTRYFTVPLCCEDHKWDSEQSLCLPVSVPNDLSTVTMTTEMITESPSPGPSDSPSYNQLSILTISIILIIVAGILAVPICVVYRRRRPRRTQKKVHHALQMKPVKHFPETTARPTMKVDSPTRDVELPGPTKNFYRTHKQDTDACLDDRSRRANQTSVKDKVHMYDNLPTHAYMKKIIVPSRKRVGLPDNGYGVYDKQTSSVVTDGSLQKHEYCYIQSDTAISSSGCREGARQGVYEAVGDLRQGARQGVYETVGDLRSDHPNRSLGTTKTLK